MSDRATVDEVYTGMVHAGIIDPEISVEQEHLARRFLAALDTREKYERYAKEWAHSFQEWRTMYDAAMRRTEEAVALLRECVGRVVAHHSTTYGGIAGRRCPCCANEDDARDGPSLFYRIDAFLNTFADLSVPDASGDDGKVSTQGAAHEVPRAQPGSQSGGGSAPTLEGEDA